MAQAQPLGNILEKLTGASHGSYLKEVEKREASLIKLAEERKMDKAQRKQLELERGMTAGVGSRPMPKLLGGESDQLAPITLKSAPSPIAQGVLGMTGLLKKATSNMPVRA